MAYTEWRQKQAANRLANVRRHWRTGELDRVERPPSTIGWLLFLFCAAFIMALLWFAWPAHAQRSTTVATCGTLTQAIPPIGSAGIMAYDQNGSQCVSASVTASVTGFAPAGAFANLTATNVSASVALPAGAVVLFQNTGTTTVSCTLGVGAATATANMNQVAAGGWLALTVGSNTFGACIDQTGSASNVVVLSGGSGLPTGAGGGGSGGGGGAVTVADGADVAQGTTTDAACATDNGTCTELALIKRANQRLTTINTTLGSPLQAGGTVQPGNTANTTPWLMRENDGTNSQILDPCQSAAKVYLAISQTANTQLFAGTSAKKTYVCHLIVVGADAENISLVSGTGATCGTSTAAMIGATTAANGLNLSANGGFSIGVGGYAVAQSAVNADNVCLFQSGAGRVSGVITYVAQ